MSVGWRNQRNRGPWLYAVLHTGARWFRDPWQNGIGVWLTLKIAGRYLIFKRWGA